MAPNSSSTNTKRECTAQQRLEERQKVEQPIVLCSGVQVLFYRPASFGLRLPHLCHSTLERNLGRSPHPARSRRRWNRRNRRSRFNAPR